MGCFASKPAAADTGGVVSTKTATPGAAAAINSSNKAGGLVKEQQHQPGKQHQQQPVTTSNGDKQLLTSKDSQEVQQAATTASAAAVDGGVKLPQQQTGGAGSDSTASPATQQQQQAAAAADAVGVDDGVGGSCPLMVLYKDVGGALSEAPLPDDEQQRCHHLCTYDILDTEPEEAYDRISALCKTLFNVPIAMVTFVDKDRVWIKSVQGLSGLKQVERRKSLCAWTLLSRYPEALVVTDLTLDVRFKDSPIVTEWPAARFYAACPLVAHTGARLGTLCILDTKAREFSADSTTLLTQLANMVMREVERKRAMNDALCSAAVRHTSGSSIIHDSQALMLVDMATPKWSIYLVNDAWQKVTGISQEMAVGSHFWDLFEPPPPAQVQAYKLAIEQHRNFELRVPVNINSPTSLYTNAEALLHSSSGSFGGNPGSVDGMMMAFQNPNNSGGPQQQGSGQGQHQQGPMHGVRGWSSTSGDGGQQSQSQQQPALAGGAGGGAGVSAAVIAATAAAAERSGLQPHLPAADAQQPAGAAASSAGQQAQIQQQTSRRRSIGGGMRHIRFQFRSVSSVGSHMAPAVSVPPALVSMDRTNYYWATVDAPHASTHGDHQQESGYTFGLTQGHTVLQQHQQRHAAALDPGGASATASTCPSSSQYTMPSSDSSSAVHAPMRTTFSLLPEDNPFQDITIGSLLGWGSYGRVHRGYWNGSLVAVKVLEQVAGDFNPRSSLEPLLHHRLSHPNVVAMFDVCTQEVDVCEDGQPLQEVWMVLEFCNRGTLSDAIQRGWLLSVQDGVLQNGQINKLKALTTAREVSAAMEYLHSQNVLHGDLNGNNILLAGAHVSPGADDQRGFTAKVADFGLSRLLSPENEKIITKTHGTITHMAPEVITEATHSKAADVYSFGVVLFELVSGLKPYVGMHYAQIVASITSGKLLQLLPEQAGSLPAELKQLMAACLATNPAERPTFAHVHATLGQLEQQALQEQQQLGPQALAPASASSSTAAPTPASPLAAAGSPLAGSASQLQRQQLQQQLAVVTGPKVGAAAAAAAAAAVSAAASAAGSSMGGDSQALMDLLAAAQQQQPPPGAVTG